MLDVYCGDLNVGLALLVLSIAVVLPAQLLLCFKAKSRVARLLPASAFAVLGVSFLGAAAALPGRDGLGYVILAIYAALMVLMCAVGWCIWWFANRKK